jgi:hypothetical protein
VVVAFFLGGRGGCCWAPTGVGSSSHVVTGLNGLVDVLDSYWARPSGWASVYIVQSYS